MRFKFFVILVLIINIFSLNYAWAAAQNIDSQIASEERHRKELDKKIKDYRKQIQEMGAKVKSLLGEIDTLQQDEAMAGQELVVLELQNQKIKENINLMSKAMGLEQNKISELEQQIKNRLVDMYKYGVSGEMNLIFASQNISEAVEAVHLLKIINDHDENILSQLKSRYENIELSRHILKEQQELLTRQSKEVEDQRDKYKKTISETNSFIKNIQREKALAEKASREAEEAQRAVGRTITNLMNRKKAMQAQQKKQSTDYLKGSGTMLDWPVRGQVTSKFGNRVHPMFKTKSNHSGIDIAAPSGTPVKAAASGEVLYVGWMRGYGQVIILDHGRNITTVYAHLSSTRVSDGQVIRAGSVIGGVGKTGNATGYHLHFEVRVNGKIQNPLSYLKG
ncbi:MAG: peptidoglycan DD-metalloendopeptidase family protein [Synergistaceae bacterium]|nr:peptidoglycan DD-metalloendopeptidase family protein [Synergistaceae bacterium]MBQ6739881.1 peptidoglycan DD-metalloendopeptidase family protein [Synergistaceae bacterium]MBQ7569711.1 peptidoglycan DD-metalloendopeptidase family protein [Synergistaceae bacterium]MBQ9581438.1 peptidoglycan DD-metalloendopeptidase family protein [Synergistaceae bacterium]MBQ9896534.1 peptidoglycan DD-metalloendopeptidase family protein [Synergistaceae bacterium]